MHAARHYSCAIPKTAYRYGHLKRVAKKVRYPADVRQVLARDMCPLA